jgi:hypothetical protein
MIYETCRDMYLAFNVTNQVWQPAQLFGIPQLAIGDNIVVTHLLIDCI